MNEKYQLSDIVYQTNQNMRGIFFRKQNHAQNIWILTIKGI